MIATALSKYNRLSRPTCRARPLSWNVSILKAKTEVMNMEDMLPGAHVLSVFTWHSALSTAVSPHTAMKVPCQSTTARRLPLPVHERPKWEWMKHFFAFCSYCNTLRSSLLVYADLTAAGALSATIPKTLCIAPYAMSHVRHCIWSLCTDLSAGGFTLSCENWSGRPNNVQSVIMAPFTLKKLLTDLSRHSYMLSQAGLV